MLIQEPCNRFGLVLVISSSVEQYLRFAKRVKDLWSLIILRIWYLGRSINRLLQQSSLEEISDSTSWLWNVSFEFLQNTQIWVSFFSRNYACLFSVRFLYAKTPSSFHSLTLSVVILLQQILNCSSLSEPMSCMCFNSLISIDFGLLALNTRLFLMDYFASELISLTNSLMHVSFFFRMQLRYKVESSPYCIQVLSGAMPE